MAKETSEDRAAYEAELLEVFNAEPVWPEDRVAQELLSGSAEILQEMTAETRSAIMRVMASLNTIIRAEGVEDRREVEDILKLRMPRGSSYRLLKEEIFGSGKEVIADFKLIRELDEKLLSAEQRERYRKLAKMVYAIYRKHVSTPERAAEVRREAEEAAAERRAADAARRRERGKSSERRSGGPYKGYDDLHVDNF